MQGKLTTHTPFLLSLLAIFFVCARIVIWSLETVSRQDITAIKWEEPSRIDLAGRAYQLKLVLYYFGAEDSTFCQRINAALLNRNVVNLINSEFLPVKVFIKLEEEKTQLGEVIKELRAKMTIYNSSSFAVALPSGTLIDTKNGMFGVSAKSLLNFLTSCQRKEKYVEAIDALAENRYSDAAQRFQNWLAVKDEKRNKIDALKAKLYIALSYKMLGDENRARQILLAAKGDKSIENGKWPKPIISFLLGEINGDDLLKECEHTDYKEAAAYYFMGMMDVKNENIQSGLNNFQLADKSTYASSEIHNLVDGQLRSIGRR